MAQDIKSFKTIEEQIAILEDRGLIIEDKDYASRYRTAVSRIRSLLLRPFWRGSINKMPRKAVVLPEH